MQEERLLADEEDEDKTTGKEADFSWISELEADEKGVGDRKRSARTICSAFVKADT